MTFILQRRDQRRARDERHQEKEPTILVRARHSAKPAPGPLVSFGGRSAPGDIYYALEVEVVNVGQTIESVRAIRLEDAKGANVGPRFDPSEPSPLTRDRPVLKTFFLTNPVEEAADGFYVVVELASGRQFRSDSQELDKEVAVMAKLDLPS